MTNETKKEVDIAEFKSLVESNHKILGLDIGSKRIGVAISTSDMTGALPLRTIKYSNMKGFLKELNERSKYKNLVGLSPVNNVALSNLMIILQKKNKDKQKDEPII